MSSSSVSHWLHQYVVVGRHLPTEKEANPQLYRMRIFAPNTVVAKSRFWYFLSKLKKVKKANGQVLALHEVTEATPTAVKNYGIWVRYQSRTGTHNMYKEFRDTSLVGAVEQMYNDMASQHHARFYSIQIIKTVVLEDSECVRPAIKQFHDAEIRFPLVHRKPRPSSRQYLKEFTARRPTTIF